MTDRPTEAMDLDACAAEPIRIPGGIQPHGALIVLSPSLERVAQVSANAQAVLGLAIAPGQAVAEVADLQALAETFAGLERGEAPLTRLATLDGRPWQVSAHRTAQGLILEFESAPEDPEQTFDALYPRLRRFLEQIGGAPSLEAVAETAVREVRALTGFNRVLLYSFDADGVGTVLAEDTDDVLPSYLNLRFPGSDIPAQARELYKLSRIRLIPTCDYAPAAIAPMLSPVDGQPLDLGRAALRSVSPVHLEYMRNMGTASSMSISIIVEGELWGLVSGHSREPRFLGPQVRSACDHLGQVLSLQIEAHVQAARTSERLRLNEIQTQLLTELAVAPDFAQGLAGQPSLWQAVGGGAGAALVNGEEVIAVGLTPDEPEIRALAERLFAEGRREAVIESLAEIWPESRVYADRASGLLAVAISQIHPNYLMWFRPEAVRTVFWAGEPQKPREIGARLHPRQSFALWKEQVRLRAAPWSGAEAESAEAFREAIQNIVLKRAEERAELTNKLTEINQELESFSYSISHDLRAPFRHVVGFAELLNEHLRDKADDKARHYIQSIRDAGLSAGRLVDDLLNFSQLGRNSLSMGRVDLTRLAQEVRRGLTPEARDRRIEWRIGPLPLAWGDAAMIRQVMQNLMENAVKYSANRDPAVIEVVGEMTREGVRVTVRDNGVGFDMAYAHKLFSVFERLHRADEFEGTGIGLALVRRIVERHGGAVSAEGAVNQGASFTFTLPRRPAAASQGDPVG